MSGTMEMKTEILKLKRLKKNKMIKNLTLPRKVSLKAINFIESGMSGASKQSYQKRIAEAKKEAEDKPEWDKSTVTTEKRK